MSIRPYSRLHTAYIICVSNTFENVSYCSHIDISSLHVAYTTVLATIMIPHTVASMPIRTRLQRERERRATESALPMPGSLGRGKLLRLQATGKPHCGRKGSRLEL